MDSNHSEECGEDKMMDLPGSSVHPLPGDCDVESSLEVREEQIHGKLDETSAHSHDQNETSSGENEDMEEDETEGLPKALKKRYKAVKKFFKRSKERADEASESILQQGTSPELLNPDDDVYNFNHKKRGLAIIINNEKFQPNSGFESRAGSKNDETSLKKMFKHLGFHVQCYNDLEAMAIKQALEKEARQFDHGNADCLAVAILSHGDSEVVEKAQRYHQQKAYRHDDRVRHDLIFGVDGVCLSTASVIRTFQDDHCPGLQGKPRLFFFQACRGDKFDEGTTVHVVGGGDTSDHRHDDVSVDYFEEADSRSNSAHHKRCVTSPAPIFKDFLVMYATTPGHFAWRRSSGTWFIQSLHEVFMDPLMQKMSLTQALTRVNRMVAQGYESQGKVVGRKQTSVVESMLIKEVYFFPRK